VPNPLEPGLVALGLDQIGETPELGVQASTKPST
jgi:hypothetical protein